VECGIIAPVIVSNASPLIALSQINQLNLLERLFTVLIPPAVVREIYPTVVLPNWITERELMQPIGLQILNTPLGSGEKEAISLAREIGSMAIIDERPARKLAKSLGINVIGTLGILFKCKQKGFIPNIRPYIDDLINNYDFRIANDLYERILIDAGELP
jgi:uncharacterized protein